MAVLDVFPKGFIVVSGPLVSSWIDFDCEPARGCLKRAMAATTDFIRVSTSLWVSNC